MGERRADKLNRLMSTFSAPERPQMLKAIYLDLDGTIVDLVRHTYRLVLPESLIDQAHDMTTSWDSMDKVITELTGKPFTDADLHKLWRDGGQEFWATVPWLPWGRALFDLCRHYAPVVLMTTPTFEPSCAAGKMQWINDNIPAELVRRYALSPCKHHMAHPGALLIDDGEHNIDAFREHGGEAFLWPGPWNEAGKSGMSAHDAINRVAAKIEAMQTERIVPRR